MFGQRQQNLLVLLSLGALLAVVGSVEQSEEQHVKEDIIEIENKPQKVIRVSTLELPTKQDHGKGQLMNSELFQIQTLRPHHHHRQRQRQYIDSKRMRPGKNAGEATQSQLNLSNTRELKAFPKQKLKAKQLHYPIPIPNSQNNQPTNEGEQQEMAVAEAKLPLHLSQGVYPIYYVVSRTNGRFGKFPIKSFRTPAEFAKYLIKSKAEPIPWQLRYDRGDVKQQQQHQQQYDGDIRLEQRDVELQWSGSDGSDGSGSTR